MLWYVVVFGLGKVLLFISALGHYDYCKFIFTFVDKSWAVENDWFGRSLTFSACFCFLSWKQKFFVIGFPQGFNISGSFNLFVFINIGKDFQAILIKPEIRNKKLLILYICQLRHGVSRLMGLKKQCFCSKINCIQMKLLYFVN